ncbi:MAG: hypothetical protein IJ213_03705 [Bacteroidales bacterium]|nr:hypothetical protein [Bacteroidales bacterium]
MAKYIKNAFYIEDTDNIMETYLPADGNKIDMYNILNYECKEEAIMMNHELNHYIQNLLLNACITEGEIRDYLSAFTKYLSNYDCLKYPIDANKEYNYSIANNNTELKNLLDEYYKIYNIHKFIFVNKYEIEDLDEELCNAIGIQSKLSISIQYLLEYYAYQKSYMDFYSYNSEGKSVDELHDIVYKQKVYPIVFKNGKICTREDVPSTTFLKDMYRIVGTIMLISNWNDDYYIKYLQYCENYIPYNYRQSIGAIVHSLERLILETALNIPSFDFIRTSLENKDYDIETFSPVHRFYKILKNINHFKSIPEKKEGEDFFKTFYNWCAEQNNWPTYDVVFRSMGTYLFGRAIRGGESVPHYQWTAIRARDENYKSFVQLPPLEQIMKYIQSPIIIVNKMGVNIHRYISSIHIPSKPKDFYTIFFAENIKKYEIMEGNTDHIIEKSINNSDAMIRECLFRLFSESIVKTYTKGYFHCPLHKIGCSKAKKNCEKFYKFREILEGMQKNILRTSYGNFMQGNNNGNTEDCMFYNYLLDKEYKNIK